MATLMHVLEEHLPVQATTSGSRSWKVAQERRISPFLCHFG